MTSQIAAFQSATAMGSLADQFMAVRERSTEICEPLQIEDYVIQSMPSVSPTKWHLAHTTWFFERFILQAEDNYSVYSEPFDYLFNSYYQTIGAMHPRAERGQLSRPNVKEVLNYRQHVDSHIVDLLSGPYKDETEALILLGMHHEQQHQELMLTDIKHVLSGNPLQPAYTSRPVDCSSVSTDAISFMTVKGGILPVGADQREFCFDNETPRHDALVPDFLIADRLTTNHEFRAFINDGGYTRPDLWLADGWRWLQEHSINRPLYWAEDLSAEFSLHGQQSIADGLPVCHISFYEADAYARWSNARLLTEEEWETAASQHALTGNFYERGLLHPAAAAHNSDTLKQIHGDVWEWTASAYRPYPGYKPWEGSLGEYNGKFMCNQMVARGGSCVTAQTHMRTTYRNFFYPSDRWQFFGIRLAKNIN